MFTGIIEELGNIIHIAGNNGINISIEASFTQELKIGDSVAINGACLTITDSNTNSFTAFASKQTLLNTNLSLLKTGQQVNLERALPVNGRLDGHLVYGHIDTVSVLTSIQKTNESYILKFNLASEYKKFIINKGSITINGVSLTVYNTDISSFSIMMIPHTYANTTFKLLKPTDKVNIEFDVIGKYILNK